MRIPEIDIARGFTVFIMAAIHALMIYSTPDVHVSWLGKIMFFLAEGPGAPLFMMMMGISFVLSGRTNTISNLKRAGLHFVLAYVLNFFKFLIPLAAGIIPAQLLSDFGIASGDKTVMHLFLLGDILQLAAISMLVLSLLIKIRNYQYWAMLLAIMIALSAPYLWEIHSSNTLVDHFCNLLWGYNSKVYFPVFPWLVYPLVGVSAGYFLKLQLRITQPVFFIKARNVGIALVLTGLIIISFDPAFHWGDFYRTGQGGTIYYTGFVLLWLYGCHLAVKYLPQNYFFRLLTFLSKHITRVYLVQWILIFWLIGVIGYRSLDVMESVICITIVSGMVFSIAALPESISKLVGRMTIRNQKYKNAINAAQGEN
ncbi:MAG TPA: heparan-alpha-glucosaminide N-acetyltransferase domain-containing protein [Chitinophagaceae bacterium]